MQLDEARRGVTYQIVSLEALPRATARRLEALGMTQNTLVDVLNNKSDGCVIIRLRKTRHALGRGISSRIACVEAATTSDAKAQVAMDAHAAKAAGTCAAVKRVLAEADAKAQDKAQENAAAASAEGEVRA